MKTPIRPKLKDLQVGDEFYPASKAGKNAPIYRVTGKLVFNDRHGRATRMCLNKQTGIEESKSSGLEVVKIHYCLECGTRVSEGNKYCWNCCEDSTDY